MKVTDEMVSRFLCWQIPDDFKPDFYISFDSQMAERSVGGHWPTGTNLFTADQARAMLQHVLEVGQLPGCAHPSWETVSGGKERCLLCGAIGKERRYLRVDAQRLT